MSTFSEKPVLHRKHIMLSQGFIYHEHAPTIQTQRIYINMFQSVNFVSDVKCLFCVIVYLCIQVACLTQYLTVIEYARTLFHWHIIKSRDACNTTCKRLGFFRMLTAKFTLSLSF